MSGLKQFVLIYMHRLLQNSEDGKIVEGTDPRLLQEPYMSSEAGASTSRSALERSAVPTYSSSAEDDTATHRKLEGLAAQYNTLLKSQLEQQRIFYQGRLAAIRQEHEQSTRHEPRSAADLILALKRECNQLEQRCVSLRRKHKKIAEDTVFLENMNESLEVDKHSFREKIAVAQAELAEAKKRTQQRIAPLEKKVSLLMLQLEEGIGGESTGDDKKPSAAGK